MSGGEAHPAPSEAELVAALHALAQRAETAPDTAVPRDHGLTATEALTVCDALLTAVGVEVFELAMWRVWGVTTAPPSGEGSQGA